MGRGEHNIGAGELKGFGRGELNMGVGFREGSTIWGLGFGRGSTIRGWELRSFGRGEHNTGVGAEGFRQYGGGELKGFGGGSSIWELCIFHSDSCNTP